MRRIVYLHGFASSPQSTKAQFFKRRLAQAGVPVEIPELADEGFEKLTISGQLRVVEHAAKGEPVSLVGSSMGGYLAALYASLHEEVERLILMAPAFGFARNWEHRLGKEAFSEWRRSGYLDVYHYGNGAPSRVGFQLIEDGLKYPDEPDFRQPALIFHGTKDDVVLPSTSIRFVARHTNARLQLFDSGHELTDVMEEMWYQASQFWTSQVTDEGKRLL